MRGEPVSLGDTRRALRLFFAVTDTGIGISADKISKLFKPFSQVDTSSKRLCELMGGSISVESLPGKGTTFRFSVLTDYEKGDTLPPSASPAAGPPVSPETSVQ
jgi:signal transduction histidine kinase